ncbi:hypothetical protein F5J12DRAFT_787237 [Pisolithus orientalis]|uniref:uncharacterized protein n=1 Tax=Pisolithus orientalis TaxID=936130 RepID=UPI0022246AC2|nr:uncharacterized protein F5J12DRAFT_787237 [Pisolithus orientalis]KAI5986436.1 hypothetical protein F5J12DRAFT_787237 [Pisolithus orientalis]
MLFLYNDICPRLSAPTALATKSYYLLLKPWLPVGSEDGGVVMDLVNGSSLVLGMVERQVLKKSSMKAPGLTSRNTGAMHSKSGRHSEAHAGDLASVPATIGMASLEIAGPGSSGGAQKEQEQSQADPGLDAAATSSGSGAQARQETSQTVSTKNVCAL